MQKYSLFYCIGALRFVILHPFVNKYALIVWVLGTLAWM